MIPGFHGEALLTPLLKGQGIPLNEAPPSFNMETAFSSSGADHNSHGARMSSPLVCRRCHHFGVDVKLMDCGCYFHARCTPVSGNLGECPACHAPFRTMILIPMNFGEIDAAKEAAASMEPSSKRGKKRKNATIARLNPSASIAPAEDGGEGSDLRTGRWTTEETLYCDKLIEHFESGSLPVTDGIKLNDFLANMLKSKQSRLTKKMKNARLSAKAYKHASGFIANFEDAKEFSDLEKSFFDSIQCDLERAEIRFHMQKEWRELFSSFCVAMKQKLDADSWLSSVEEMDRRVSQAKDAARMARRKTMMGYALSQDSMNQERGVFIENPNMTEGSGNDAMSGHLGANGLPKKRTGNSARSLRDFSSPFVGKVIQYMDRHQVPFEHIDAWVPSFIPTGDQAPVQSGEQQTCRLCFAGFATTDFKMPTNGGRAEPMSAQDHFDLLSFGEYSSKFSFDVGCGLPGRVYSSGICSWEQGVANAPSHQFERCGGASQWGIKTVLGIPIPSPNVGRIVVLLYSRYDRPRDEDMVRKLSEELTKLMPTPKWKLVVDVGAAPPKEEPGKSVDSRVGDVLKLITENTPTHRNSPHSAYLPGFEALRQLLLKQEKTDEEEEVLSTTLDSYSSYLSLGRRGAEVAWMIARDFMLLTQPQRNQLSAAQSSQMHGGHLAALSGANPHHLGSLAQAASQSHHLNPVSFHLGGLMPQMQQKQLLGSAQQAGGQAAAHSFFMNGASQFQNAFGLQASSFQPMPHPQGRPSSGHQGANTNVTAS